MTIALLQIRAVCGMFHQSLVTEPYAACIYFPNISPVVISNCILILAVHPHIPVSRKDKVIFLHFYPSNILLYIKTE
jgi:hypothetical protein